MSFGRLVFLCFVSFLLKGALGAGSSALYSQCDNDIRPAYKIGRYDGGMSILGSSDKFGSSITKLGDLNNDGNTHELAVGAHQDDDFNSNHGAVYILFIDDTVDIGNVDSYQIIGGDEIPVTTQYFGFSLDNIGDLDGDSVTDLVVGAPYDPDTETTANYGHGAAFIVYLNTDGTSKAYDKISNVYGGWIAAGGSGLIEDNDYFGWAVAGVDDLNNDGNVDIVVCSPGHTPVPSYADSGACFLIFLNQVTDGSHLSDAASGTVVSSFVRLDSLLIKPGDANDHQYERFGTSVCAFDDWDLDGTMDLVVGADTYKYVYGAVYLLILNSDATIRNGTAIVTPELMHGNNFGVAVASAGDLNLDGVTDLLVTAQHDYLIQHAYDAGTDITYMIYIFFLNPDFTYMSYRVIHALDVLALWNADDNGYFGSALLIDDLNNDGTPDLWVGSRRDHSSQYGAIYNLPLVDCDCSGIATPQQYCASTCSSSPCFHLSKCVDTGIDTYECRCNGTGYTGLHCETRVGETVDLCGYSSVAHLIAPNYGHGNAGICDLVFDQGDNFLCDSLTALGQALVGLGDLNGDSFLDMAVGSDNGQVFVFFLDDHAEVLSGTLFGIGDGMDWGTSLSKFGNALCSLGDFENDEVGVDLVVGDYNIDRVFLVYLDPIGEVQYWDVIYDDNFGGDVDINPHDRFGYSLANVNDVNADGVSDIVVGMGFTAVMVVFLQTVTVHASQTPGESVVAGYQHISNVPEGFVDPSMATLIPTSTSEFASSMSAVDFDGDSITDVVIGSPKETCVYDNGATESACGSIYLACLNSDGMIHRFQRLQNPNRKYTGARDSFGMAIVSPGDLNGDGIPELIVGLPKKEQTMMPLFRLLYMNEDFTILYHRVTADYADNHYPDTGGFPESWDDRFNTLMDSGTSIAILGDIQNDGLIDLVIGAPAYDLHILDVNTLDSSRDEGALIIFPVIHCDCSGTGTFGTECQHPCPEGNMNNNNYLDRCDGELEKCNQTAVIQKMSLLHGNMIQYMDEADTNSGQRIGYAVEGLGSLTESGQPYPELTVVAVAVMSFSVDGEILMCFLDVDGNLVHAPSITVGNTEPSLVSGVYYFGSSIVDMGDIDGDGVKDLAVGDRYGTHLSYRDGAAYLVYLNANGTAKAMDRISNNDGGWTAAGGPVIATNTLFGSVLESPGDLDGDGVTDLVAGMHELNDDTVFAFGDSGMIWVMFLCTTTTHPGTVMKNFQQISNSVGYNNVDPYLLNYEIGTALQRAGDWNLDGVPDMFIGNNWRDEFNDYYGAVWLTTFLANGTLNTMKRLNISLAVTGRFGASIANLGDQNGDGIPDIAVGDPAYYVTGFSQGTIYLIYLTSDFDVSGMRQIGQSFDNFPYVIPENAYYGATSSAIGDFNHDGITDLIIGAHQESIGGYGNGAVYIVPTIACNCTHTGYHGIDCHIDYDDCASSPCQHGSVCSDWGPFECDCTDTGYKGFYCQKDIDECESSPCLHDAECMDSGPFSLQCGCEDIGYTGKFCETDIDECASNPCQNGSPCQDLGPHGLVCNCTGLGYTGKFCETDIDECASSPCFGDANCVDTGGNTMTCDCHGNGYTGLLCDIDIDDCSSSPCNSGSCEDGGSNLFRCNCDTTGFQGEQCDEDVDDCLSSPCLHGGVCVDTGRNAFACSCDEKFTGDTCDVSIDDPCLSSPCSNGATCVPTMNMQDYACDCSPLWTGVTCSDSIEEATSSSFVASSISFTSSFSNHSNTSSSSSSGSSVPSWTSSGSVIDCQSSPCRGVEECIDVSDDESFVSYECICPACDPVLISIQFTGFSEGVNSTDFISELPSVLVQELGGDEADYIVHVTVNDDGSYEISIQFDNPENMEPDVIERAVADASNDDVTNLRVEAVPVEQADENRDKDDSGFILIIILASICVLFGAGLAVYVYAKGQRGGRKPFVMPN